MEIGGIKPEMGQAVQGPGAGAANSAPGQSVGLGGPGAEVLGADTVQTAATKADALRELLISYGLKPGDDNILLMRTLMEAGLPSDRGSFLKLNQALKLFTLVGGGESLAESIDKAVFAFKNDLPPTVKGAQRFQAFLGEAGNVSKNLDAVLDGIKTAPKNAALEEIMKVFVQSSPEGGGAKSPAEAITAALADGALGSTAAGSSVNSAGAAFSAENTGFSGPPQFWAGSAAGVAGQNTGPGPNITNFLNSISAEERSDFLRGLMETADTSGHFRRDALPDLILRAAGFLTKQLNPPQPFTEAEARQILGQIFKDMPEAAEAFTSLSRVINSGGGSALGEAGANIPGQAELTRAFEGLRLAPFENDHKALEEALNNLKFKTEEALKIARNSPDEVPAALSRALENITNNLSFIDQLKTCVYIPIPLNTPTGHTEGELYIFKDGKAGGGKGGAKTALIGLNTVNLGRVEAYIHKEENRLNIQFRLGEAFAAELLSKHSRELTELMESAGLKLVSLSTTGLEAPFRIIDAEKSAVGEVKLSEHRVDLKA